jgi:hypothetical protein
MTHWVPITIQFKIFQKLNVSCAKLGRDDPNNRVAKQMEIVCDWLKPSYEPILLSFCLRIVRKTAQDLRTQLTCHQEATQEASSHGSSKKD